MLVRVPLKQAILDELARVKKKSKKKWTSGFDLERLAEKLGFKPSSGGRRSRELAADGKIERSETEDGYVQYKAHKAKTATVSEIIAWEDIDQRSVLLRERPVEKLLEEVEKTLIDKTDECGGYELLELTLPGLGKTRVLTYKSWSSEKRYIKFVPLTSTNALETVASLRHQTVEQLKESNRS